MTQLPLAATVVLFCWLAVPPDARAYLDPGTGSAVIQMVVAGVMGALFVIKMYWRKLAGFFNSSDAASASASGSARDNAEAASEGSITRDDGQ